MDLKINDSLNALDVHDSRMDVLITGGKDTERALVQDVIFNALEGAGFRNLLYMPNAYGHETPSMEVKTLLDAMKESNPDIFDREIVIEQAWRAYDTNNGRVAYPDEVEALGQAQALETTADTWMRAQGITMKQKGNIQMELGNGALTIRF